MDVDQADIFIKKRLGCDPVKKGTDEDFYEISWFHLGDLKSQSHRNVFLFSRIRLINHMFNSLDGRMVKAFEFEAEGLVFQSNHCHKFFLLLLF